MRPASAYAAYIAGILINVVGFAGATGRAVPLAATRIYQMSFFTGFAVSALTYWLLTRALPVRGMAHAFEEVDVSSGEERDDASFSEENHGGGREGKGGQMKGDSDVYDEKVKA
jgi:NCS1 family nucleobase:cation symporter-1